jgi:hypothetical protein
MEVSGCKDRFTTAIREWCNAQKILDKVRVTEDVRHDRNMLYA